MTMPVQYLVQHLLSSWYGCRIFKVDVTASDILHACCRVQA